MQAVNGDINKQVHTYFEQMQSLYGAELFFENIDQLRSQNSFSGDIESYNQAVKDCQECSLSKSRKHLVFGCGDTNARLMLIGEAPGEEEDKLGDPFVGKAGQLLDKILAAIDFKREEVYITNIIKCRPPRKSKSGS